MKILQIAPAWIDTPPDGYGGTEWVIYNLINGLVSLGHQVTLFATKNSRSDGELAYVFEKSFLDQDIPWEAALPALLHYHQAYKLADQFDIVHSHLSSQTDMINLPLMSDLHDQKIPAVMTIHGHPPYDRFSYVDENYQKFYSPNITVLNISKAMEKATSRFKFRSGGVVYNSMDTSTIDFNPNGGDYLTWLGKIVPDKGTHEAILAAKEAGERLVFAGIVDKHQRISVEYFETKVKPLIDGDQIVYLGPADLKMKNELLGKAKGFLNPINWIEPFGMVMVESMAAGTPVISYRRGAATELIEEGKTGFLVNNIDEMVQAIAKLPQLSRADCRQHVEDSFSPKSAALAHLELYTQEINRTSQNSA